MTELYHYGIKGQRWGVRRYQNEDGTYTSEGKERRYTKEDYKSLKKEYRQKKKDANRLYKEKSKEVWNKHGSRVLMGKKIKNEKEYKNTVRDINELRLFGNKKAQELYNDYKNLKIYKANLKGKSPDSLNFIPKTYFNMLSSDIDEYGFINLENTKYVAYNTPDGIRSKKVITIHK